MILGIAKKQILWELLTSRVYILTFNLWIILLILTTKITSNLYRNGL